ncbi:MAG: hypothetical protein V7637_5636 [Mycobacteriales bacterium]|jgi:hypothetical protein
MTVIARLDHPGVAVEPGEVAIVDITVHNSGRRVEAYHLDLVGEPAAWASVNPAELSIYPGDDAHAQVTFTPPRAAGVHAGPRHYGVRVMPVEHPEEAVVPEGTIELRPFADVTAELTPRTSHGRGRARHELAVDNRGNTPVPVELVGQDPDEELAIRVSPATLIVGPGEAAFARIRVRPTRRRWTGQAVSHPFQVTATPEGGTPMVAAGSMLEDPVLPRWLGKAVAVVLVLGLLAAGAWFALLRPAVRSAAQSAVAAPMAQTQAQSRKADQSATAAKAAADKASGQTGALGKTLVEKGVLQKKDVTGVAGAGAATPPPPAPVVVPPAPFDQRLTTVVAATKTGTQTITIAPKQTLSITDLVYENPQGDTGTLTIRIGDRVLFGKGLANFRDLTDHFVSPIVLTAGQTLVLDVNCATQGKAATDTSCRTALIVLGAVVTNKS